MKACTLVALAVVAFLVLSRTFQPPPQMELVESSATSPLASMKLPTKYGVYAITDGQLRELEALPGQVSERRIIMTMKPSRTVLRNGPLSFLVYRPDMALGAPEQVEMRAFAETRPSVWTIGKVVRPLSTASLTDAPEMGLIGPEILNSGRYVLVIKGQPYDFAVRE